MPLTNSEKQARFRAKRRHRDHDLIAFVRKCHSLQYLRNTSDFDIAFEAAVILHKHNIIPRHPL